MVSLKVSTCVFGPPDPPEKFRDFPCCPRSSFTPASQQMVWWNHIKKDKDLRFASQALAHRQKPRPTDGGFRVMDLMPGYSNVGEHYERTGFKKDPFSGRMMPPHVDATISSDELEAQAAAELAERRSGTAKSSRSAGSSAALRSV